MVRDLRTGFYEWGCYDSNFDHLWDLDDVADFLKGEYSKRQIYLSFTTNRKAFAAQPLAVPTIPECL
jgi:hypothetical protein